MDRDLRQLTAALSTTVPESSRARARASRERAGNWLRGWQARIPDLPASLAPAWSWWLAPILLLGVGLPLLAAALSGNLTIPHIDAWSYGRSAIIFAETGRIKLFGWGEMTLIGQIVMLGPLGRWVAVQQGAVAVLAGACLYCIYDLVRCVLPQRRALLATATFAIWPGFAALATSFMTDVPALTASLASLALGQHALRRDSRRLLTLALLIGVWGFTIREQVIAAPLTVLAYAALTASRRRRVDGRMVAVAAGAVTVGIGVFLVWYDALPDRGTISAPISLASIPHTIWTAVVPSFFTLATVLAPAIIAGARPLRWRPLTQVAALVTAAVGLWLISQRGDLLIGTYFTTTGGDPGNASGMLFPDYAIQLLNIVGVISGTLLAGALIERPRTSSPTLNLFAVLTLGITLFTAVSLRYLFDRYLLPLGPWVLVIALQPHQADMQLVAGRDRPRQLEPAIGHALTAVAFGAILLAAAATVLNDFAGERAHWNASQQLVQAGYPAARIDTRWWHSWYSPDGAITSRVQAGYSNYGQEHLQLPCASLSNWPLKTQAQRTGAFQALGFLHPRTSPTAWTLIGKTSYRRFLLFGAKTPIYLYATHVPGCPATVIGHRG